MSKYLTGLVVILASISVFAGPTVSSLTQDSQAVDSNLKKQAVINDRMNVFAETSYDTGSNPQADRLLNRRHNNNSSIDLESEILLAGNQHANMNPGAAANSPTDLFANAAAIAEPGSLALIGIGMIGLALLRRHTR